MGTYLVTGAAGFVGSNLVTRLVDEGHTVRGLDNFQTGYRSNLKGVQDANSFELIEGDVRDAEVVARSMEGVDHVLHQAAIPSVPRSLDAPVRSVEANCLGTTQVLEGAREADIEKVVVASSSSVYGPGQTLPKQEEMPVDPASPYALTKFFTERLAVQYDEYFDIDCIALRYFNVFGPRQDPDSDYAAVIPKFVKLMVEGRRPTIYGDGEQSRDFTYVENVVRANVSAAEADVSGEVVNVACNDRTSLNALVEKLNGLLGTDFEPRYDDPRPGDVRHSLADIDRAEEAIGYEVTVGFDEGLRRTVDYYRDERE